MKKHLNIIICVASFLVFSFCSALISTTLSDFGYDRLAYNINDYNSSTMRDKSFHPTIINIVEKEENTDNKNAFDNALSYFYYNQANGNIRNQVIQDVKFGEMPIKLETQPTFSIKKSEKVSPGYYIDYGLYSSYYMDEILGNRGYLSFRYDCDSFIFISDTFADKLIEFYGIDTEEPYKTLIEKESYCVLPLTTSDGNTIKFCINNILYTNARSARRTYELYGDFALFYYRGKISPSLQLEFEIDFKDSPYSIKKTLKDMEQLGYRVDNYNFSFKRFDEKTGFYVFSDLLTKSYLALQNGESKDALTIVGVLGVIVISFLSLFFISKERKLTQKEKRIIFIIDLICSLAFGIVVTFIYNYTWFSVGMLAQLVFTFVLFRKELINVQVFFNQRESVQNGLWKNKQFYEIKI